MVKLRSGVVILAMVASIAAVEPARKLLASTAQASFAEQGYNALAAGDRDAAVAAYSGEIGRFPQSYMAYYRRGVTLHQLGRYQEALKDFDEAVRLSPQALTAKELGLRVWNSLDPQTHILNLVVLVHAARAQTLAALNKPESAIADLDTALAMDPRPTMLRHIRGELNTLAGRFEAAVSDFDTLLARRFSVEWTFGRGLGHYLNGNWPAAEADFATAARINPQNGTYAFWLMKAQLRNGGAPTSDATSVSLTETALPQDDCTTAVFLGEWLAIRGNAGAPQALMDAMTQCRPMSIGRRTAVTELQRLQP